MFTSIQSRLKKAGRLLPVVLLPLAAHAQLGYPAANAVNAAGTYTDLAATGTAIATANTDDANSAAQAIGFSFTFNGTAFTQFVLSTNGMIKLGATAPSAANLFLCNLVGCTNVDPVTSTNAADVNLIMPFNFDLEQGTAVTAEYRVATTGTAPNRVCTIQWKNVRDKSDATPVNTQYDPFSFQAKLYETTNNIEFVYGAATASTATPVSRFPVVGIKGSGAATGQTVLASKTTGAALWSTTSFITGNYTGSTHNFRNAATPDAGRTYRFVPGTVVVPTAPVNDVCTAATVLPVAPTCTVLPGTTTAATASPATVPAATCAVAGSATGLDVWYAITVPASGAVTVTTSASAAAGTNLTDTILQLYTGTCGALVVAGCSDDATGLGLFSQVAATGLTAGSTVYARVFGFAGSAGGFGICATSGTVPPPVVPYATLPIAESFEGPWINGTSTRDLPTANWLNTPVTGDNSWRREDDGFVSAGWRFVADETGTAPPYVVRFSTGAHSARFHSFASAAGLQGKLDLYANLSGTGVKTLSFDYINPTGADKMDVLVSTDGGTTFGAAPVLTALLNTTFTNKTVTIAGNSATTVIRFQATADFGADDIGIDNVRLGVVTTTRNEALAATVSLSPNPTHQRFTLGVPAGSLHAASVHLLNALGQVVQTRQLNLPLAGGNAEFDVNGLAPGVYSLQLKTSADLVVKRVVVE